MSSDPSYFNQRPLQYKLLFLSVNFYCFTYMFINCFNTQTCSKSKTFQLKSNKYCFQINKTNTVEMLN